MKKRIISGVLMGLGLAIVLVLRQLSAYVFDAAILVISVLASLEIAKCMKKSDEAYSKTSISVCAALNSVLIYGLFLTLMLTNNMQFFVGCLFCLLAIFVIVLLIINAIKYKKFLNIKHIMPLIYPNFLFMFFYLINHFEIFNLGLSSLVGLFGIIMVFAISSFTDIFAMLIGMMIKGPKLCPKLSPKKTISGAIGGLVFGTAAGLLIYGIFGLIPAYQAIFVSANVGFGFVLLFSFISSILNQIGDLFESLFKRKLNIKDTGTIIAGHGGIMDRLDGVSFVTVWMFVAMFLLFV